MHLILDLPAQILLDNYDGHKIGHNIDWLFWDFHTETIRCESGCQNVFYLQALFSIWQVI